MVTTGYDPSSGLVYTETLIGPVQHTSSTVASSSLGRPPPYSAPPSGAHSLEHIVMRKLLRSLGCLNAASLRGVPSVILEKIWTSIRRSNLDSIRTWQIFAASSIGSKKFVKTATVQSKRLDGLVSALKAPSCAWVTNLSITVDGMSPVSLGQIADIRGLKRLHIAQVKNPSKSATVFDDRLFRSWADMAKGSGAFSQLCMLFVYQCRDFTHHSLPRLRDFPALVEVCTFLCGLKTPKKSNQDKFGWSKSTRYVCVLFLALLPKL